MMEFALPSINVDIASRQNTKRSKVTAQVNTMRESEQIDLNEAVRTYYRRIYYFSLHLSRNPTEAADLTQHAYEMLARKKNSIADPSKLKSWLHSTVYRKFIDKKRRANRFPAVELEEETLPPQDEQESRDNKIDAKAALSALCTLEDELRAPLSLFYLENYSYKEIAETLDLPTGTVMSRLYRGKKRLYQQLTGESS